MGTSTFLSKIDLSKGFYQIPVNVADRDKTAFVIPFGKYRFRRMPFGLRNGPTTFQRAMQDVLAGQEEYLSVYIDDILIFSHSWEEHVIHVRAVLEALRQHGLTEKPSKYVWGAKTLEYIGGMARLLFLKPELQLSETVLQFDKSNQERCPTQHYLDTGEYK